MSFWTTSDNDDASRTGTEYDAGGGNFDPIPDGSTVLAMPEEVKWDTVRDRNEEFISVKWQIVAPQEYANRRVFQKLFVTDDDPNVTDRKKMDTKRDKAKRMLATIDANAGGKLSRNAKKPNDQDLAVALVAKQMIVRLGVWEMTGRDGSTNSGNWVQAIFPKGSKELSVGEVAPKKPATVQTSQGQSRVSAFDDEEDSVPF